VDYLPFLSEQEMKKILLQTTIPYAKDDWSIERFSILADLLSASFHVTARDRENLASGNDPVLSKLDGSDFDELWLFGVDTGGGLGPLDCEAVGRFRQRGGAILTSRDHQDLGISFCDLGGVGGANHFHSKNPEPDPERRVADDKETPAILWPNYHSGSNGDFQRVESPAPLHSIMRNAGNASGAIEFLPAHPHEGAISVPVSEQEHARVVALGKSAITGHPFNIAVAFERNGEDRAVVDSSFHHFLDYNFDPRKGCPSFVTEPSGSGMLESPQALADTKKYIHNIARWLAE
jgi:hypothetical protein